MPTKSKTDTYLTIAIPRDEMKRVNAAAAKNDRSKSNWAWIVLRRELDREEKK